LIERISHCLQRGGTGTAEGQHHGYHGRHEFIASNDLKLPTARSCQAEHGRITEFAPSGVARLG
jgi:hypothetical protein